MTIVGLNDIFESLDYLDCSELEQLSNQVQLQLEYRRDKEKARQLAKELLELVDKHSFDIECVSKETGELIEIDSIMIF